MKRYVIVTLIEGEAKDFHENLVKEICERFNVKPQKLPMHITLKAPFEIESIEEVEKVTEKFVENKNSCAIEIKDYNHFRDNVIFMDVLPSIEAKELHREYYKLLKDIKDLKWSSNEGEDIKFHCTLVSRRISSKFKDIWDYVIKKQASFKSEMKNITIMEYNFHKNTWEIYKKFYLKD
ncbi:2'-5' RNA ligase family protein [Clostridium sp.]|uniref:2'-5' RNA ligase family protein n=1 Tax=Clostridium sp. TaxID=1506 RepID=UPI00346479E6